MSFCLVHLYCADIGTKGCDLKWITKIYHILLISGKSTKDALEYCVPNELPYYSHKNNLGILATRTYFAVNVVLE